MVEVLTPTSDEIHELNAERSAEVLERVLADHTPVRVLAAIGELEVALIGVLTELNEKTLSIELDEHRSFEGLAGVDLNHASFHITLESADTPFFFCVPCLNARASDSSNLIELQRPEVINAIERRLYRRRTLRKPMGVTLSLVGTEKAWQCEAAILNASPTGLACLVGPSDTPRLPRRKKITVSLGGASPQEQLVLSGQVVNVTEGATKGTVVLGIEFHGLRSSSSAREQFWSFLHNADERS